VEAEDASLGTSVLDGTENQHSEVRRAFPSRYLTLLYPHSAARGQSLRIQPGGTRGDLPSDLWQGLVRQGRKNTAPCLLDGRELRVQRGPDGRGTENVCCCLVCHVFSPNVKRETTGSR
jgi:hypothetical protein